MRILTLSCVVVCVLAGASGAQSIYSVGSVTGQLSSVRALSPDGRFATGYSTSSQPGQAGYGTGFAWSASQGRYDFGLEAGLPPSTRGLAISDDGGTVVGTSYSPEISSGVFRWNGEGTYLRIGGIVLPSYGTGVSGDGSVVVGYSEPGPFPGLIGMAFRWTQDGGFQNIGTTRPGNPYTRANAISRDGASIVGRSTDSSGFSDAYVWTESGGMAVLPNLPGRTSSHAWGTNFDGSIVVGTCSGAGSRGVRWQGGNVHDLGQPPAGYNAFIPNAVSDDGGVIVGQLSGAWTAGVWTPDRGIETLHSYLTAMGVMVPEGWVLYDCPAISADGLTFGGSYASTTEGAGFVITVPAPASCFAFGLLLVPQRRRRRPAANQGS